MRLPLLLLISLPLTSQLLQAGPNDTLENDRLKLDQQAAAVRAAATAFCTELHRAPFTGLPSVERMQQLSPHLTPELASHLERARVIQEQFIKKHPQDKPPWVDGDLFSSLFEGTTGWEIEKVTVAPTIDPLVKLKQHYVEAGQKPAIWNDTLLFKQRGDKWLLDDVLMGGKWDFRTGVSLRSILPGGGKADEDHTSLNEQWKLAFTRQNTVTTRITVQAADKSSEPVVLYGKSTKKTALTSTWATWNATEDKLALRIGDSEHFAHTLVFQLKNGVWQPLTLPAIHAEERKTMTGNGFREEETLVSADHWQDVNTLVLHYFTSYTNGSDGDGYSEFITVRFDASGQGKVVEIKDTPGMD